MTREAPKSGEAGVAARPVVLCILDGWGYREDPRDNAIAQAETPVYDRMLRECPFSKLVTSGTEVGLPEGQMGNSEVGHINLGGGRVVVQDLPRIDDAIASGALGANPALIAFAEAARAGSGTCHLSGLLSPGGVHSHQDHILALARELTNRGLGVRIHAFLDGRDTPPVSARGYMETFAAGIADLPGAGIVTLSGRYYAMDRDQRWERTELAYEAIVSGTAGHQADNPLAALDAAYGDGVTDEFVAPVIVGAYTGMADGDALLMANFRSDRVRQILTAMTDPDFDGFERPRFVKLSAACGMTRYSSALDRFMPALFPHQAVEYGLGEIAATAGRRQLRIAETEKYAHVTFFFNGGREEEFEGEDRILVPSPKVATYDLKPEMSAGEVTGRLTEAIGEGVYDLIVVNFANPDMVGHTGIMAAAIKAVETVDACLGRLQAAVDGAGGVLMISADHGNVEMLRDPDSGQSHTAHTVNVVPFILAAAPDRDSYSLSDGRLADVAPTVLRFLGLGQPAEMTGTCLLSGGASRDQKDAAV